MTTGPARQECQPAPHCTLKMVTNGYEVCDITLTLCGIALRIVSELPLRVNSGIGGFQTAAAPDVTVQVRSGVLRFPDRLRGSDRLMDYAAEGEYLLAAGRNTVGTAMAWVKYRPDFSDVEVLLDVEHFGRDILQCCEVLKNFPIRQLLARYDAVLLHSSRVKTGGRAILFSAPSGTGKSTQARLWEQYAGARIVSSDRTIVRRIDGRFVTSGFPVDGSEPILDPGIIPLGAVVLLRQGTENRAERIPAGQALAFLMEQTALNRWDGAGMTQAMLFWSDLLAECPAILLTCRPDEGAVRCLQDALRENGGMRLCP